MSHIASLASLASTSVVPSQTTTLTSLFAISNASAHPVQVVDLARYDNMNTKDFNRFAYSLNYTQTGCFSQGALPVALASEDICLPGWYCTSIPTSQLPPSPLLSEGVYGRPKRKRVIHVPPLVFSPFFPLLFQFQLIIYFPFFFVEFFFLKKRKPILPFLWILMQSTHP